MEVRGVGIVEVKHLEQAELALVVDLVPQLADVERLPDDDATARLLGVGVPLVRLCPWEASAAIKLAVALARAKHIAVLYPFLVCCGKAASFRLPRPGRVNHHAARRGQGYRNLGYVR